MSKDFVDNIDATPSKRIYQSIIADYGFETAICELIDNSLDAFCHPQKDHRLVVKLEVDAEQQSIVITDNAGGVPQKELKKLISPGESSASGVDATIGVFGVGSKRAVVALAQQVRISTRFRREGSYRVEYDDEWLASPEWDLPYYVLEEDISPSATEIRMSSLRFQIKDDDIASLREHLSATYAKLLARPNIAIEVNGDRAAPRHFDQWAFPPEWRPHVFSKTLPLKLGDVRVTCKAGLRMDRAEFPQEYGVYIYCNDRLVTRALKLPEVGFSRGIAGVPHFVSALVRVVLEFSGPSHLMPWNSSKSGVNFNHPSFVAVRGDVVDVVKHFAKLSRSVSDEYETLVRPFDKGDFVERPLGPDERIRPSYLPAIPRTRATRVNLLDRNEAVISDKPWTRGLVEALVAEELIRRRKELTQRTRISLILIDSTVEIALKEFLTHSIRDAMGDKDGKLEKLFNDRTAVHREASKHLPMPDAYWQKLEHFYKHRCDLIHRKASANISDKDIVDYRRLADALLAQCFGLDLSSQSTEVDE